MSRCTGSASTGDRAAYPGWHELDWDGVSAFLDRWQAPDDVDIELDAVDGFEANADRLLAMLLPNEPRVAPRPEPCS